MGRGRLVDFNFTAFHHVCRAGKAAEISTVLQLSDSVNSMLTKKKQIRLNRH